MALNPPSKIRDVLGITPDQKAHIYDFLQGAVYCWCMNRRGEWFSMRDLMGGENTDWGGIPLIVLYQKYLPSSDAVERAGRDSGWLLKRVIGSDTRQFETKKENLIRKYRWIP